MTSTPEKSQKRGRFDAACKEMIDEDTWLKAESFFLADNGLYIHGPVGTGKTFLCYAIMKECRKLRHGGRIVMSPVNEIFMKIKNTFRRDYDGMAEESIIAEYAGSADSWKYNPIQTLIIDDLGVERPTDWAQETLYAIIDRRYRDCRQTIFSSNYSLDELSERIGDRITSRIAEMCKVIELKGKDRRVK